MVGAIEDSEEHDFRAEIRRAGYDDTEFEVGYSRILPPPGAATYPLLERVTVSRQKTGVIREYDGGHGAAWGYQAMQDVVSGQFGPP